MKIVNVIHKGLRRFIEDDDASGLPAQFAGKIRKMVEFLQAMDQEDELRSLPLWKPHQVTGDRAETWGLFVSRKTGGSRSKSSIPSSKLSTWITRTTTRRW